MKRIKPAPLGQPKRFDDIRVEDLKKVNFKAETKVTTKIAAILQAAKNTTHITDEYILGFAAITIWKDLNQLFRSPVNGELTANWVKFTVEYENIFKKLQGIEDKDIPARKLFQKKMNWDQMQDLEDYLIKHSWDDLFKYNKKQYFNYLKRKKAEETDYINPDK